MILEIREDEFRAKIQEVEEALTDTEFKYLKTLLLVPKRHILPPLSYSLVGFFLIFQSNLFLILMFSGAIFPSFPSFFLLTSTVFNILPYFLPGLMPQYDPITGHF